MARRAIRTGVFEGAAGALAAAALLCAAAGALAPGVTTSDRPDDGEARRRLAAARAVLAGDGARAGERFDTMIDAIAAGAAGDAPGGLARGLEEVRRRRRAEPGPDGTAAVLASLDETELALGRTSPTDRAATGRALAASAAALLALAGACAWVSIARARALRRRLSTLVRGAPGRGGLDLADAVALELLSGRRRARRPAAAEPSVPGLAPVEAGPARPAERDAAGGRAQDRRALLDVTPISDDP